MVVEYWTQRKVRYDIDSVSFSSKDSSEEIFVENGFVEVDDSR